MNHSLHATYVVADVERCFAQVHYNRSFEVYPSSTVLDLSCTVLGNMYGSGLHPNSVQYLAPLLTVC